MTRKKFIIVTLLLLISSFSFTQNEECFSNFHTGIFGYSALARDVTIERTSKKQIETDFVKESQVICRIKWVNDSVYVLTFIKAINLPGCMKKGDKIRVEINHCSENFCTALASSEKCGGGQFSIYKLSEIE